MSWMLDWLACALVRVVGGLLCCLPASAAVWLGERLGGFGYWLQPTRTRIGLLNLRAAFDGKLTPDHARRIIRACYRQLGAGLIELLRLPVIDRAYVDRYVTIEGRHHVEDAVASGRPVIFLTGHYGNWELSSIVAALRGYPITALARAQEKFPRLYRLLVSYRESKGCTIVHKGGAVRRLLAALEHRQFIGIVGDQASRQGLFVEFFGRLALFAPGPFELAYRKDALIVPAFIRRVRGPFHRLIIESPISLSRETPEDAAVRTGIEQFAGLLSRHISADPSQWLWMHKRWKRTPARRVLVLSDGKLGHLKQSLTVVEALREDHPTLSAQVVDIRYRHALGRLLTLLWSWWMPAGVGGIQCLSLTLTPRTREVLLGRYADLIVSCGSPLAPVNLLWAVENRAKSVVIMNPAPLPFHRFSLVIVPRHDRLRHRSNVVQIAGALTRPLRDDGLAQATARLRTHPKFRSDLPLPRNPVITVLIGGDTPRYAMSQPFAESLISQVKVACEATDGWCLVTTSRRTSGSIEEVFARRLEYDPRCRMLLVASRDSIDGTMEGLLGLADVVVVTGESISMVSEACASGRPVVVIELPPRQGQVGPADLTKHQRFLRHLVKEGYAHVTTVHELSPTIQLALSEPHRAKRLDNIATIRGPLAKLL